MFILNILLLHPSLFALLSSHFVDRLLKHAYHKNHKLFPKGKVRKEKP